MARILLDVDGVIGDFVGSLCDHLPGRTPEQFTRYPLHQDLSEVEEEIVLNLEADPNFILDMKIYPGARQFVAALHKAKHDVRAVTAMTFGREARVEWLRRYFNIPEKHTIFCHSEEKPYIRGDVLIEDREDTCIRWYHANRRMGNPEALLVTRPWTAGALKTFTLEEMISRLT